MGSISAGAVPAASVSGWRGIAAPAVPDASVSAIAARLGRRIRRRRRLVELLPGRLGRALLGLLLAAPFDAAEGATGHDRPRGERLGVIRPGILDAILRNAQ